jgi:hypothetical protein
MHLNIEFPSCLNSARSFLTSSIVLMIAGDMSESASWPLIILVIMTSTI